MNSRVRHETPKEVQRISRPKCCDYNNKDEPKGPNIQSNNKTVFVFYLDIFPNVRFYIRINTLQTRF